MSPFKSEKQRRFLWMKRPDIARRWTEKYGSNPQKDAMVRRLKKHGKATKEENSGS